MTLTLIAALLAAGPDSAIAPERIAELRKTLTAAEEKWSNAAPTSYSYRLIAGGPFGYSTYAITVDGNECKAKTRSTFGKKVSAWEAVSCEHYLVENIFAELHRQFSIPQELIDLSFDPDLGFPIKASFQPHSEIPDQSEYFEISAFKVQQVSTGVVKRLKLASVASCVAADPVGTARWIHKNQHAFAYQKDGEDLAKRSRFLSADLFGLLGAEWRCQDAEQGICTLDSDVWVNAQDGDEVEPITFDIVAQEPASATVRMRFQYRLNDKTVPSEAKLKLVRDAKAGCWLLDDLVGRDGESLKQRLEAASPAGALLIPVKSFYSWVLRNGKATERLAPAIKDVPGTNHFALDTSTVAAFEQKFMSSGFFAPEFGAAVDRYYAKHQKHFDSLTQKDFDELARDGRGPQMEVEDMDLFFCAQEYEYKPEFVDALKIANANIQGDRATAVIESTYQWKTTFHFKKSGDKWLITGYCVYE